MALRDIGREQVLAAIAEYDRLGQDEFLATHGFHPAREYLLVHDGNHYDSKAIVGVAHGYLNGQRALKASEFSGGEATVGRLLRDLGFAVQVGTGVTPDRLAKILGNLAVNRPNGIPALYQPIMLLWAFGRATRREPRLLSWPDTERPFCISSTPMATPARNEAGSRIRRVRCPERDYGRSTPAAIRSRERTAPSPSAGSATTSPRVAWSRRYTS